MYDNENYIYLIWCGNFRMTLLLGPPSSGKTTLLLALAGKLDRDLRVCSHFHFYIFFKPLLYLGSIVKNDGK